MTDPRKSLNSRVMLALASDVRSPVLVRRLQRVAEARVGNLFSELKSLVLSSGVASAVRPAYREKRVKVLYESLEGAIDRGFEALTRELTDGARQIVSGTQSRIPHAINIAAGFPILTGKAGSVPAESLSAQQVPFFEENGWIYRGSGMIHRRLADTLRIGIALNENEAELARRVVSAKKRSAQLLGRTGAAIALSAKADAVRAVYEAHAGIIKEVQHISHEMTAGSTNACRALSGLRWSIPDWAPVQHSHAHLGGIRHFGCKSFEVPVFCDAQSIARLLPGLGNPAESVQRRAARNGIDKKALLIDLDGKPAVKPSARYAERQSLFRRHI